MALVTALETCGYFGSAGRKWVYFTRSVKNLLVGVAPRYFGSAATSVRTAVVDSMMFHFTELSLFLIALVNCQARSGFLAFDGMDQAQPPDMLTLPGA